MAAMENGADAVYFGLKALNARANARNFSLPEGARLIKEAHGQGKKALVAMNALLKEEELPTAVKYLAFLEEAGADGVIVQDLGLVHLAKRHFPGLPLHGSTLMGIHNSLGVKWAARMGLKRMVLAREMTIDEIATCCAQSSIEIEVFVHGAMCFTYSGLCLMSSYFGGRSSTRGQCVQPCRRRYRWGRKEGNFFSMDDLCGLDQVHALGAAGVTSLKIEGRLRPAHYVASVVKAYRLVLDAQPGDRAALEQARTLVAGALGRKHGPGYFLSSRPSGAVTPSIAANTGLYLGKAERVKAGRFFVSATVQDRDRLRVVTPQGQAGFNCAGVETTEKGTWVTIPAGIRVKRGDLVFLSDRTGPAVKLPRASRGGKTSEMVHRAETKAARVLKKTASPRGKGRRRRKRPLRWMRLAGPHSLTGINLKGIDGLFILVDPVTPEAFLRARARVKKGIRVVASLPPVIPEGEVPRWSRGISRLIKAGVDSFEVANLSHLELLSRRKRKLHLHGSYTLNLLNSKAIEWAESEGLSMAQFSVETEWKNMSRALDQVSGIGIGITVYGRLPLFTSRMDHPSYNQKAAVISPKNERLSWTRRGPVGLLLPRTPINVLDREGSLAGLGIDHIVLDLAFSSKDERKMGLHGLRQKKGRSFNLEGRLY